MQVLVVCGCWIVIDTGLCQLDLCMPRCVLWRRRRKGVHQECCMPSMWKWAARKAWYCEGRPSAKWRIQISRFTLCMHIRKELLRSVVNLLKNTDDTYWAKTWNSDGNLLQGTFLLDLPSMSTQSSQPQTTVGIRFCSLSSQTHLHLGPPGKNLPGVLCHQVQGKTSASGDLLWTALLSYSGWTVRSVTFSTLYYLSW